MIEECQLQLQTECILNVPLQTYDEFSFIVNGKEFKTSRLTSDLLSPKICKIHENDKAFNKFEIKTNYDGNFSHVLNLVAFNPIIIPSQDIPFVCEVIEILGNKSIQIKDSKNTINNENVFALIHKHEQFSSFYSKSLEEDVDYISGHFFELVKNHEDELKELSECTLKQVLMNPKLKALDEDQILTFVNHLYLNDPKYSMLYEYVSFENVEGESIDQFLEVFSINHLTNGIWKALSRRMKRRNENITNSNTQQRNENITKQNVSHHPPQTNQLFHKPTNQPKYQPIQPYQLQQLQQQLLQQEEEKLRQQEEEQLRQQQLENIEQKMYHQRQEQLRLHQHQNENLSSNQNIQQNEYSYQQEISQTYPLQSNQNQPNENSHEKKSFKYDSNNQFSGIINYLGKESQGNIDDVIDVTASSISGRSFPSNVTYLLDKNKRFCSTGEEENPWICFDFRNYQIIPSDYTIRSCDSGWNPKSWVIEGSKDNSNWTILDEQKDCSYLNGDFNTHTFSITNSNSEQYRYLRMRLTGTNWQDNNLFIINSFEIYGTLL